MTSVRPVAVITVEEMENAVEETDNRNPKGDKVLLGDNRGATHGKLYLRSLIWLGLMYPPFWLFMLKYIKATLIFYWKKNIDDHHLRKCLSTSSELSHTIFTLDSMACDMEGHVELIDRHSRPSN